MNFSGSTSLHPTQNHKIVFLGDSGVGKTAIVERIAYSKFDAHTQSTIILDTLRKNVSHNGKLKKLQLWDTAGQEKFSSLIPSSIRDNDCSVIVFDVSDSSSLQNLERWLSLLEDNSESPAILVGNKIDLKRKAGFNGFDWAVKHKLNYIEVSAKSGAGIEDLVNQILNSIEAKEERATCETENSDREGVGSGKMCMPSSEKTINLKKKLSSSVKLQKGDVSLKLVNKKSSCCSI